MAFILLWSSAVRVRDSHAYRKMDVTRECISHILELREILLSFQTGFNLVNTAVVCAILEEYLGLGSLISYNRNHVLEACDCQSIFPFILISVLMPLVLIVISLVFLALISML